MNDVKREPQRAHDGTEVLASMYRFFLIPLTVLAFAVQQKGTALILLLCLACAHGVLMWRRYAQRKRFMTLPFTIWLCALIGASLVGAYASLFKIFRIVQDGELTTNGLSHVYFSVVTFTTLGYGDFVPYGPSARMLAASEAICGYLVLGVVVYSLTTELEFAQTPN